MKKFFLDKMLYYYTCVGGIAAVADLCLFFILFKTFHYSWWLAATISFVFATLVNYVLCIHFVFKHAKAKPTNLIQTYFVSGIGLGLHHSLLFLFFQYGQLPILLSKLSAMAIVFLWNFTSRKYWVFLHRDPQHNIQTH